MAEKKTDINEKPDDETSLEKEIERLDKDDPEYAAKRDRLTEKLTQFRKELIKTHKKIKKQRIENQAALNLLQRQAEADPQNKDLQLLLKKTQEDRNFLILASAEIVSIKGNLETEMKRLQGSKDFNVPLDIKAVTGVRLKPLPSERQNRRREQTREAVTTVRNNVQKRREKDIPLGRKIQMLRRTMPGRSASVVSGGRNRERI